MEKLTTWTKTIPEFLDMFQDITAHSFCGEVDNTYCFVYKEQLVMMHHEGKDYFDLYPVSTNDKLLQRIASAATEMGVSFRFHGTEDEPIKVITR